MLCPYCGKSVGDVVGPCDDCKPIEAKETAAKFSHEQELLRKKDSNLKLAVAKSVGSIVGILLVGLIVFLIATKKPSLSNENFATSKGNLRPICNINKSCMIVYLAPWCPSCTRVISRLPAMKAYLEKNTDSSLEVIIGYDSISNLEAFASKVGFEVVYDRGSFLYKQAGLKAVPSYFSVDQNLKIIAYSPGYLGNIEATMAKMIEKLNLS